MRVLVILYYIGTRGGGRVRLTEGERQAMWWIILGIFALAIGGAYFTYRSWLKKQK